MRFSSSRESANRHTNGDSRATVQSVDDTQLMQQVNVRLFYDEQQNGIEHFEPYGFSSVMQPPSLLGSMLQAAEAFFAFLGGNRSHGVALTIGDRRFRLINKQPGEVALYDDQGQWIYLRRNGILVKVPPGNSFTVQVDGQGSSEGPGSGNGQDASQIPPTTTTLAITQNQIILSTQNEIALAAPTINVTAQQQLNLAAPTLVLDSPNILMGGASASRPVAAQGTTDNRGNTLTGEFLTMVKGV
jgi:phage gp45-like